VRIVTGPRVREQFSVLFNLKKHLLKTAASKTTDHQVSLVKLKL